LKYHHLTRIKHNEFIIVRAGLGEFCHLVLSLMTETHF